MKKSVFEYTSVCCEAPAKKPPVVRTPEDVRENKFSESGLGKWRCTNCKKNAKVKRTRIRDEHGTKVE